MADWPKLLADNVTLYSRPAKYKSVRMFAGLTPDSIEDKGFGLFSLDPRYSQLRRQFRRNIADLGSRHKVDLTTLGSLPGTFNNPRGVTPTREMYTVRPLSKEQLRRADELLAAVFSDYDFNTAELDVLPVPKDTSPGLPHFAIKEVADKMAAKLGYFSTWEEHAEEISSALKQSGTRGLEALFRKYGLLFAFTTFYRAQPERPDKVRTVLTWKDIEVKSDKRLPREIITGNPDDLTDYAMRARAVNAMSYAFMPSMIWSHSVHRHYSKKYEGKFTFDPLKAPLYKKMMLFDYSNFDWTQRQDIRLLTLKHSKVRPDCVMHWLVMQAANCPSLQHADGYGEEGAKFSDDLFDWRSWHSFGGTRSGQPDTSAINKLTTLVDIDWYFFKRFGFTVEQTLAHPWMIIGDNACIDITDLPGASTEDYAKISRFKVGPTDSFGGCLPGDTGWWPRISSLLEKTFSGEKSVINRTYPATAYQLRLKYYQKHPYVHPFVERMEDFFDKVGCPIHRWPEEQVIQLLSWDVLTFMENPSSIFYKTDITSIPKAELEKAFILLPATRCRALASQCLALNY